MTLEQVKTLVDTLSDAEKHELVEYLTVERVPEPASERDAASRSLNALELMALPYEERSRIFAEMVRSARDVDFEVFEAYSEEDIDAPYYEDYDETR